MKLKRFNDQSHMSFGIAWLLQSYAGARGFNVGLTGGVLYRAGLRKDIDFVFYNKEYKAGRSAERARALLRDFAVLEDFHEVRPLERERVTLVYNDETHGTFTVNLLFPGIFSAEEAQQDA